MSLLTDQPLGLIDPNVSSAASSLNKTRLPIGSSSKLKIPTPVSTFKRPAQLLINNDMKRSRIDLSTDNDAKKSRSNLRRSKSLVSVRGRVPLASSAFDHPMAVKKEAHVLVTAATLSRSNAIRKVPSLCSVSSSKTKNPPVTAPASKTGKRPAWDLKGRLQDTEESLKEMNTRNVHLVGSLQDYDQRLIALEEQNSNLANEARFKESISLEKSEEVETLRCQLKEKTDACVEYEKEKIGFQNEIYALTNDLTNLKNVCSQLETTISSMVASQASMNALLAATKSELNCSTADGICKDKLIENYHKELESLKIVIEEKECKSREDEKVRRQLHNTIQELKGNIRVFCRVRPVMNKEHSCKISFPESDDRCIEFVRRDDPTDTKNRGNNKFAFTFDHVFDSSKTQEHVFEEVSQLVQSALDGYNVCVFAYGQTGSGKTFTMEGSLDHDQQSLGMIPRTVSQIFDSIKRLESHGWTYEMTASFIEIYNENIRDLLGDPNEDKKHEIKMVDTKGSDVYVTNINVINIISEKQVLSLLSRAQKNRAVAATKCNERSSRSHSVFQLCLTGKNCHTTESCQGVLSLVDLAGSERLKESQSEGARLKETKSINKSLSNLSTVIMSLSQKAEHIPFRNSKLTHLLMNSLGGNSKTLMLVNVSPSEESFNETINSLRFATKVNECNIGSAQKKVAK